MLTPQKIWQSAKRPRYEFSPNLVPRSLVDEAEGEIWPNAICTTWLPVRNVTGEASAHAQHKFGAVKADLHGTTLLHKTSLRQAYDMT